MVTWYLDPTRRYGWWLSDGDAVHVTGPSHELSIPGWPTVTITDAVLDG